jgi:CrcB protein
MPRFADEPPHRSDVIDPDVDLHDPRQRAENCPHSLDLLAVIAAGGVAGAEARYGLGVALGSSGSAFPWSTVLVNASGCLLIGVLMVLVLERLRPHRLLRPFLGVGVLGGYTTFSTFAVDVERLIRAGRAGIALGYIAASVLLCLLAVVVGARLTRMLWPSAGRRDGAVAPVRS